MIINILSDRPFSAFHCKSITEIEGESSLYHMYRVYTYTTCGGS